MSRLNLLILQLLVAVVVVALWQVLTTVPIGGVKLLPPFFFSTPWDVGARIVKWFVEGTIWKHLWITLVESVLPLSSARWPASWSASGSRSSRVWRRCSIPM